MSFSSANPHSPHPTPPRPTPKHIAQECPVVQHKWLKQQGAAPDTPMDSVVIKRMRKFAAMSKLKKAALLVSPSDLEKHNVNNKC